MIPTKELTAPQEVSDAQNLWQASSEGSSSATEIQRAFLSSDSGGAAGASTGTDASEDDAMVMAKGERYRQDGEGGQFEVDG